MRNWRNLGLGAYVLYAALYHEQSEERMDCQGSVTRRDGRLLSITALLLCRNLGLLLNSLFPWASFGIPVQVNLTAQYMQAILYVVCSLGE